MFTATMQIYYFSRIFVHLELQWIWSMSVEYGFWTCHPGYFGRKVASGTWKDSWLTDTVSFRDPDGEEVAYARDVEVSLVGYPLNGLQGDKGDFRMLPAGFGGILDSQNLWWRLISV